ncbi:hypothetical protein ESZ50_04855 [Weissella muntiaci]|uniref:Uncharacterized protein n=1 Tax=Weissella muntiaci TaxID=2508881 RepID=A0A6C2C8G8_9LACO|nr:hypothetical protein [Weissella muntiaci]TYC49922.1 hypothetical protein ESZ50_04855 [Weissella muntiaci]
MSEVVEAWSFLREVEKTEKEERSVANIDWLKANKINFEFGSNWQVIIEIGTHKFDFWTTTGSWFDRKNSKHGRGRESLLRALKEAE